jgi:hypothetical protein
VTSITATAIYSSWSEDVVDASWCEAAAASNVRGPAVDARVATGAVDMGSSPSDRGRIMCTAFAIGCRPAVAALGRIVRVAMLAARAITATRPISGRLTVYAEAHECGGSISNNRCFSGSSFNSHILWSICGKHFAINAQSVMDSENCGVESRHFCCLSSLG